MPEPHPRVIDPHDPLVERLREICMRYPEAVEQESWGRPSFRAGKKIFLLVSADMDRPHSIVFKPPSESLPAYQADTRYFPPKYWAARGWMGLDIDSPDTDWTLVEELIEESYRQVALVRQVRELDANTPHAGV
jgi:predicted DNA-binding protein (MmcQ/YjbR family)